MALLLTYTLFTDLFLALYHSSISCIRQQSRESAAPAPTDVGEAGGWV